MKWSPDTARIYKLLSMCVKQADHGDTFFIDNKGLFLHEDTEERRTIPIEAFPFGLEECRHYFGVMASEGLIEAEDDWNEIINTFKVTDKGHAFLREMRIWRRFFRWLSRNAILSLVIAIVAGLAVAYFSNKFGW